jgi:membrane protein DedA with SNARE-associated domain
MEGLLEFCQTSPVAFWGLFALVVLCGCGLPMPEDIVLLAAGMLADANGESWIGASVVMYFGVLAGDSLVFVIGRRFGPRLLALRWTQRWLSSQRQERIARLFAQHGSMAFFFARFMPGLRAPIFCMAGAMGVRYVRFAFFDGLAALLSVPFFVWLGSFLWQNFGDDVERLRGAMSRAHFYATLLTAILLAALITTAWLNRQRRAKDATAK